MSEQLAVEVAGYRHGRVPRPVRERQIQAIAAELFTERGYVGTSMEEIARRSGLSRPVVYDLAGSKADLFRRVLEQALDSLVAVVTAGVTNSDDVWQGFRDGLAAFFRFADTNPAVFDLVISGSGDPELNETLLGLRARSNQRFADLFAGVAHQSGRDIERWRSEALASAVQGAADYFARWRQNAAPELTPEAAATMVADLLEPGLRAQLTNDPLSVADTPQGARGT
jgi:AcrR family transcriptional regulator